MIHYDPHRWLDHFFDIRGSLVKEIGLRVGLCTLWAVAVVVFHYNIMPVNTSVLLHSLVGVALGLLLVFRTNASYDRYWEGRKLWGGIVNETRNVVRGASVHLADAPDLLDRLTWWTAIFPWAVMSTLRGETNLGPALRQLTAEERNSIEQAQHPALHVAQRMSLCLQQAQEATPDNGCDSGIAGCQRSTTGRLRRRLRAYPKNSAAVRVCGSS